MKTFITTIALVLFAISSFSADVLTQIGVGSLLQDGSKPDIAYIAAFNIPTYETGDYFGNTRFMTEISFVYSNREFSGNSEIECLRTIETAEIPIYSWFKEDIVTSQFYVGVGSGIWEFIDSDGGNATKAAIRVNFGYFIKSFSINAGCDVVRQSGPDIYFLNTSIKLLGI